MTEEAKRKGRFLGDVEKEKGCGPTVAESDESIRRLVWSWMDRMRVFLR